MFTLIIIACTHGCVIEKLQFDTAAQCQAAQVQLTRDETLCGLELYGITASCVEGSR